MKKILKKYYKYFLCFVLGGIVFSPIMIYATYIFDSKIVFFTSAKTDKTNVSDALDELYTKSLYGDATANDILYNKKALVNGKQVTGNIKDYTAQLTKIKDYQYPALDLSANVSDNTMERNYNIDQILTGGKYVDAFYLKDGGYIPSGTYLGVDRDIVNDRLSIRDYKIIKGETINGVSGSAKRVKVGTFTTSTIGKSINCGFIPNYVAVLANYSASNYYQVDFWSRSSANPSKGARGSTASAGGITSDLITISHNTFTHTAYSNSFNAKDAIYICTE